MQQVKTIRPRNWLYELLVVLELLLMVCIGRLFFDSWRYAFIFGGGFYLVLAWVLRLSLQRHHRKGMGLLQQQKYREAIAAFQKSHDFFEAHPGIDKYRFITMFSSGAIPYQQMALNNLGLCHLYLQEDREALAVFQKLAQLNPHYPYIEKTIETIQQHINDTAE